MFTLEILAKDLKEFDDRLNEANIVYRIVGKSDDGTKKTLKFKKQEQLDAAQLIYTDMTKLPDK
jgi:hypothetical protein